MKRLTLADQERASHVDALGRLLASKLDSVIAYS